MISIKMTSEQLVDPKLLRPPPSVDDLDSHIDINGLNKEDNLKKTGCENKKERLIESVTTTHFNCIFVNNNGDLFGMLNRCRFEDFSYFDTLNGERCEIANKKHSVKKITTSENRFAVISCEKLHSYAKLSLTPTIYLLMFIMWKKVLSVSLKTSVRNTKEKPHVSNSIKVKCQLCVDKNRATFWCNTCRKNICSFCKMYHEKVWTVMNHEVKPLQKLD